MDEKLLAFMDVINLENGAALRGGCLVTDIETKPVEFRCTAAIRPTELQKVLYGKRIMEVICKDLVGIPILKNLQRKPSLVLVCKREFLDIRLLVDTPIVLIEILSGSKFKPLATHVGFEDEIKAATSILSQLKNQDDVLEPFSRVQKALEEAHHQKIGDHSTQ